MRSQVVRRSLQRLRVDAVPYRRLAGCDLISSGSHQRQISGDSSAIGCTLRLQTSDRGTVAVRDAPHGSVSTVIDGVARIPDAPHAIVVDADVPVSAHPGDPYRVFQASLTSIPTELAGPAGDLKSSDGVRVAFENSVKARTVGNASVARYIRSLEGTEYALAEAAVAGSRQGGLRIDAATHEALLEKLVDGGQLRTAMETYRDMIRSRITPTANTYALLMRLCGDRNSHTAVMTLFEEMQRRGVQPTSDAYETVLTSIANTQPVQWQIAVEIFDKLAAKNPKLLNVRVYNGMMRVYNNMTPFDWRIVYNCYFELRSKHSKGTHFITWESYDLVARAMHRGRAGWYRRSLTFVDAWFNMANIRSWAFWRGALIFVVGVSVVKVPLLYFAAFVTWLVKSSLNTGLYVM